MDFSKAQTGNLAADSRGPHVNSSRTTSRDLPLHCFTSDHPTSLFCLFYSMKFCWEQRNSIKQKETNTFCIILHRNLKTLNELLSFLISLVRKTNSNHHLKWSWMSTRNAYSSFPLPNQSLFLPVDNGVFFFHEKVYLRYCNHFFYFFPPFMYRCLSWF